MYSMSYKPSTRETPIWTFLTNHSHVIICLLMDSGILIRDLAVKIGITERAALRILHELEDEGFVTRNRIGRRNLYQVHTEGHLRHPVELYCSVGELFDPILKAQRVAARRSRKNG